MACTKSVEMEEGLPDKTSVYADEGTEAHDLLEKAILAKTKPSKLDAKHPAAQHADVAYDYIAKRMGDPRYVVIAESKVSLTEDIYGTADIIVLDQKACNIEVIDYKHGMGKMVEPDCLQLMIYGAAAVQNFAWMMDSPVKTVTTTIVQPRKAHDEGPVRSVSYTIGAITDGAEQAIIKANEIKKGDTEFSPSESACQWCKAKADCPAFAEKALESIGAYFTPVGCLEVPTKDDALVLSAEKKGAVLKARGLIKSFLAAIEDDVEQTILAGGSVPGFKLVAGRSNRAWAEDEEAIIEFCKKDLKMKVGEFTKQTLLGPAPIEKHIKNLQRGGKAKMELFNAKVVKPEGKPTIVPESDKRPSLAGFFQEETVNTLN
jgi:RecB family exonuclease